ncbi:MAG: RecX family transcriptional regulator [Bacilli bacterium]|nr:RecX family transcriptional regulator [Bacilli bacterium]
MKIEKYEKIGTLKYRLYLDNGEIIDTYDDVILENELLLKKELDEHLYNKILIDTNLQEYYNACVKYIQTRLRSTKEIDDYLKRKQVTEEDRIFIIEKLTKKGLLNDKYFTKCFINDKLKFTNMGEYRIINELKKLNISTPIIEENKYLFNEEIIQEKINKKIEKAIKSNHKLDNYKLRNKLYNSLLRDGYNPSQVISSLNQYF